MKQFPPDLESFINDQLSSGQYSSIDELLLESVRLLKARDQRSQQIQIAVKQGLHQLENGEFLDLDDAGLMQLRDEIKAGR